MSFDIVHIANKSLSVKQEGYINGVPIEFTPSLGHSEIWRKKEGFGNARKLFYSESRDQIIFGDTLGNVTVLNSEDGSIVLQHKLHTGTVASVSYSRITNNVLSGGYGDNSVKITNLETGETEWTFSGHTGPVNAVAISPTTAYMFSGSNDGTVKRLSLGSEVWSYQTGSKVTDIRSVESFLYVTTSAGEVIKLTHGGVLVWRKQYDGGEATALAIGFGVVYIGMFDGRVHAIDINGEIKETTNINSTVMDFCETDGGLFAVGMDGKLYKLFKKEYNQPLSTYTTRGITKDSKGGMYISIDNVGVIKLTKFLHLLGYNVSN